ncbi:hypothetical protein [Streptomyces caelestis]|uniref:Uncharacterized protein n=1 Tax=Streptomyces caelestis TaxID=36816 RepID=A0A7W9H7S1_9ACTN|nr:hypothetical protein [Streptomyces caelestis]MBB5797284.1 hypothetical protein [Streptomyces caelestis]
MIKMTWALVAEHMDEWIGDDIAQGAAVLEARVGAVVDVRSPESPPAPPPAVA